jgi:uncharacterized protein YbjT (DUF2867 family)
MSKTANVIGATGLIGRHITRRLLEDERYDVVRVFVRRGLGLSDPKLDERIVDFNHLADWSSSLEGDELYSAMGTTRRQAGSKERQHQIDYTYQWEAAEAAAKNGVARYSLVSSAGADAGSKAFYMRTKGELDQAVGELDFDQVTIFRPSLLVGERERPRPGERFAELALKAVCWLPGLRKYRAIQGDVVAAAMIAAANEEREEKVRVVTLDEIFGLAGVV